MKSLLPPPERMVQKVSTARGERNEVKAFATRDLHSGREYMIKLDTAKISTFLSVDGQTIAQIYFTST